MTWPERIKRARQWGYFFQGDTSAALEPIRAAVTGTKAQYEAMTKTPEGQLYLATIRDDFDAAEKAIRQLQPETPTT